jgi:AcrR family transcriptional regulator
VPRLSKRATRLDADGIVDVARAMILAEGHESFTLRRLGAELGVTAPAVYAHFESKDALLRAVARREFDWFITELAKLTQPDPVERLRAISRNYVDYAKRNTALFRLMQTYPPSFFRREYFDPRSTSNALGARLFRSRSQAVGQAIDQGRFLDEDPFLIGLALFMAVQGVAQFLMWEPDLEADLEDRLTDLVIDCMLRGLAPSAPQQRRTRRR